MAWLIRINLRTTSRKAALPAYVEMGVVRYIDYATEQTMSSVFVVRPVMPVMPRCLRLIGRG